MTELKKLIDAAEPKELGMSTELIDAQMELARYLVNNAEKYDEIIRLANSYMNTSNFADGIALRKALSDITGDE